MNVIFMGTPDFSVPVLKGLIASKEHTVTAVVTQPDKARGRSGKLVFTPVKEVAVENNIPVYTPARVKDAEFVEQLRKIPCDVIVVVAFGQILSKEILDYPKYGCINVHASLLPRWRGAAPMQWAILEGDEKTGVTTMQMAEGLDTGDMLIKKSTNIGENEIYQELYTRLADIGGEVLAETIQTIENGTLSPEKQDDSKSNYAPMIRKEMSALDFSESVQKVHNTIRGVTGFTMLNGKRLKVFRSEIVSGNSDFESGCIVDTESFIVKCGDGLIKFCEIQLEGSKRMKTADFLRGKKLTLGEKLG